VKRSSK